MSNWIAIVLLACVGITLFAFFWLITRPRCPRCGSRRSLYWPAMFCPSYTCVDCGRMYDVP